MGLNTEISWCDHTMNSRSLGMDLFVAFLTKGQSIFQNKTKIWEVCKWLDVVGAEIPTLGISTMLAREAISYENIEAPSFVFGAKSNSSPFCCFPIFVEMAFLPSPIGKPTRFAHFFSWTQGCVFFPALVVFWTWHIQKTFSCFPRSASSQGM